MTTEGSSFPTVRAFTDLGFLLDTSAAILLRDKHKAASLSLARLPRLPVLSVVSVVELEGGVYARPEMTVARRIRLDELLASLEIITFDARMSATYGQIVRQLGFNRQKIIDRMIAATALIRGDLVITANIRDFERIDGLEIETWST